MRKFLLFLSIVFVSMFYAKADTVDIALGELGYANGTAVSEIPTGTSAISIEGAKENGSTTPTYYDAGGWRVYKNSSITVSAGDGYRISEIVFTCSSGSYLVKGTAKDASGNVTGSLTTNESTSSWTGDSDKVKITLDASDAPKHARITNIKITYEYTLTSAVDPVEITYELDGAEGLVTLSCATEGASIFYGFSEDAMDKEYSEPFRVSQDCTVYAYAKKDDETSIVKKLLISLPFTNFKDVLTNASNKDEVLIIGNFQVLYVDAAKKNLILTDGTSNMLVYDGGGKLDYEVGTKFSEISASVSVYSSLFELTSPTFKEGGEGCEYMPVELNSLEGVNYNDNLFDQVILKGVNISGKNGNAANIEMGSETIAMFDTFRIGFENGENYDITGFVWRNNNNLQIVPNLIENGAFVETVKTPVISPSKRELVEGDKISIACETPGASIYYTLDGEDPTEESTLYTEPFEYTGDFTVKARAYYKGEDVEMFPSEIASRTYHVFDPTCNIITADGHDPASGSGYATAKHTCTVDGVDYGMLALHDKDKGIQMNNKNKTAKQDMVFCYLIQTGENEGYVLKSIDLDYNSPSNTVTFTVRGANTPFDDSSDDLELNAENIKNHGVEIGTISATDNSIGFEKDYKYFALYPAKTGVVYLNSITINYREPAPLTAPALLGLEDLEEGSVEFNEEEGIYNVTLTEPIEIDFDFDVNENPDVMVMYMMAPVNGGINPLAAGDDDFGMPEPMIYDGNPIEISASSSFQYWAMNSKTDEMSEPVTYLFMIQTPLVVPAMTGLDEATVEGDAESGYIVESDKVLNVGFELNEETPNIMVCYTLTPESAEPKEFEMDDLIPYDEEEGITISENSYMQVFAYDLITNQFSQPVDYMFIISIPFVAPAVKGLEELSEDEYFYDEDEEKYYVVSDKELNISFDVDPESDIEVVYILAPIDDSSVSEEDIVPQTYDGETITISKTSGLMYWAVNTKTGDESDMISYLFIINLPEPEPVAPESPKVIGIEDWMVTEDGMLTCEDELVINFEQVEGIEIHYTVMTKEEMRAFSKRKACGRVEDHEGYTKHNGEDITLTGEHRYFSYFACDPETELHSQPVTYALDLATGISNINADDADVLYFNLDGMRIAKPEKGAYIRVQKGKVQKVVK